MGDSQIRGDAYRWQWKKANHLDQLKTWQIRRRSWHHFNHMDSECWFDKFVRRPRFSKIVLHGIISIVRFLTVQCKLDRLINRHDDEKRYPLSARHVAGFVYVTSSRRRLRTVPFLPITREMEEVIAFWAVSPFDWSKIWRLNLNCEHEYWKRHGYLMLDIRLWNLLDCCVFEPKLLTNQQDDVTNCVFGHMTRFWPSSKKD